MHDPTRDPAEPTPDPEPDDLTAPERWIPVDEGRLAPDPTEPPPLELWNTVADVTPWGTLLLTLSWGVLFAWMSAHRELDDLAAAIRRGASLTAWPTWGESWRLLACTFLHSGLAHLGFNSAFLVVFGSTVERVFGRAAFALMVVLGGLAASLASVAWRLHADPEAVRVSVGGSGALFALTGALLTGAWRLRGRLAVGRARALAAAVLFFAAPAIAQGFQRVGTDNAAHVGGAAAGLALGAVMPLSPRLGGRGGGVVLGALGTLAALLLAGVFARALRGG